MKKIFVLLILAVIIIMPMTGAISLKNGIKTDKKNKVDTYTEKDFTHTVLAEGGFLSTCPHCVPASNQLYDIYNSGEYDFQYVSLVYEKGTFRANKRMISDLGITGTPDVYFDGKYKHVSGKQTDNQPYIDAIINSGERDVPNVDLEVNVVWQGEGILNIEGTAQNYDGHLRVYIVEPESRWNDADGKKFHFGVLDIPINKNLAKKDKTLYSLSDSYEFSKTWYGSIYGYEDIKQDNIMVIAAVFDKDTDYAVQTASAIPTSSSENKNNGYIDITVQEAWELLTTTENGIQIPIDVRTDEEWNSERIKTPSPENPVHYSLSLLQDENGLQEFISSYAGKEIVVYCGSGGRSSEAAQILVDNYFSGTVYNMLGGIIAWKEAGYPTPKANSISYNPEINIVFKNLLERFPHVFYIFNHLSELKN